MSISKSLKNLVKHFDKVHKGTELEKVSLIVEEATEEIKEEEARELEFSSVEEEVVVEIPCTNIQDTEDQKSSYVSTDISSDSQTKTQSLEQSCRICLCDLVEINHVGFQDSFNNITYLHVFNECTGFDVRQLEPQHLCVHCAVKLVDAYELRQQCTETQKVLDQLLTDDSDEDEMIVEELFEESPEVAQIEVYEEVLDENMTQEEEIKPSIEELPEPVVRKSKNKTVKGIPITQKKSTTEFHETENVQCQACSLIYKSTRGLRNHYITSHTELKIHQCQYCHRVFFPQLIDIHLTHCSKRHDTIRQLCPVCGEAASRNHIYRHIARSKAIDNTGRVIEKPYECDICGARATTKSGIGIHIKALHLQLKIQCLYCDAKVKSRSILATHLRRFHPEIKKPLKCEHCDFQTASAASLIRHRAIHYGNRPHKCDVCDRQYVTKDAWRVHIATHSDDRPHECEICYSPFKTKKSLGAHMKTHKPHEYECPDCRKSYLTNQQMRQHVEKNHPDFVLPPRGTIMNKSWYAKQAEFELQRDANARAMKAGTVLLKEEIYQY